MLENFNNAMYVHPRKNGSEHLCSQKLMLGHVRHDIDCKEYGFAFCSLGSLGHEKKVHLNI